MIQRGTQQLKADRQPQQTSMETYKEEIHQLREALAEREEQLSRAVKKRQRRTVAHIDTLAELNSTQAALEESQLKCASLEENLHSQWQDIEERHKRELTEQEENLRLKLLVVEENFEKKLEEQKKIFLEEKEAWRQQNLQQEVKFNHLLQEEQEKYNEKVLEKEECMKQQLITQDETFNRMLNEVHQRWESTAQAWDKMREELVQKTQESQRLRQEKEEKTKEELQRLTDAILQLELQVPKKQKRECFCGWLWKKMKFWKKK